MHPSTRSGLVWGAAFGLALLGPVYAYSGADQGEALAISLVFVGFPASLLADALYIYNDDVAWVFLHLSPVISYGLFGGLIGWIRARNAKAGYLMSLGRGLMRRPGTGVALLLLVLALTGCPQLTEVWIVPGSTTTRLRFGVANGQFPDRPLMVTVIRVDRIDPNEDYELMWGAGLGEDEPVEPVAEFTYGEIPRGYVPLLGQPDEVPELTPGCYQRGVRLHLPDIPETQDARLLHRP